MAAGMDPAGGNDPLRYIISNIARALMRIHHVAIIVDDVPEAIRFCRETLGLEFDRELDLTERGVKVAVFDAGAIEVELIQPQDESAMRLRIGPDRTARIEHIGIEVADVRGERERLMAFGAVSATELQYLAEEDMTFFFTDPDTTDGVRYQYLQLGARSC
jgi:catechol 2,3-dioxygenase-like lactoylglutathione lyase family enzyme